MSLATRINPQKRPFRDDDFERYQYSTHPWFTPPTGTIADATTRPDLHTHHFHTRRGRRIYETYKPEAEGERPLDHEGDISIDDNDLPEISVLDVEPEGRRVHFTPRSSWCPASPMDQRGPGEMPKPSLASRMKAYATIPDDYNPGSPFLWDTSAWIEEEELEEQQQPQQRQRVQPQHAPFAQLHHTQQHVPAAASPSALGLSGLRKFQPTQSKKPTLRQAVLNRKCSELEQLKSFPPGTLDQTVNALLSSSVADRPKLTPTRRLQSPSKQLTPPKPSSPEAVYTQQSSPPQASSLETVYPSLSASYYDLGAEPPHRSEAQQSEEPRYIDAMAVVTTLGNYLTGLITNCWNFIRGKPQPQQIVAIETDTTGRKRRAVAGEDVIRRTTPSPQLGDVELVPGQFPALSSVTEPKMNTTHNQRSTPPDSRPVSSERQDTHQNINASREMRQQPSPPEPSRNQTEATQQKRSTMQAPPRKWYLDREEDYVPPETPRPSTLTHLIRRKYRLPTTLRSPEDQKMEDAKVDDLITKAKKVTLESEEDRAFRKSYRTRAQKIEDAKLAKEREAQAKADVEREAEELRKRAAEAEERRAAQEAEEEERRAAEEAAEGAKRALKARFIRPISEEWADKIRTVMKDPDRTHDVATTPGTATTLSRSDFMKLLPQKDASGQDLRPKSSDGAKKVKFSGWLNDEVVNGWNECIVESFNMQNGYKKGPNTVPEVAAFNCAWLTTLRNKNYDMKSITGWARRLGIKGKTQDTKEYKILKTKKIFFPINSGAHWLLMIIDAPNREIQVLDSLSGKSTEYFKLARQWLQMELAEAYVPEEWTESKVRSQQQKNYDDCGVFTCINALASATGVGFTDFGNEKGMEDARRMMSAVLINGGFTGEWEL
ncbi:uncharacterized protein CLAFUR5_10893 [Fulvia fulva]|uniref:Ubiquitin-like protease family profile domain-containing protein n=1 Tax=Passalora fulva TaxID=5499 RepID=A0A9Q8PFD5_PASFU|nr:uncharacterized protein CLAFUR5_10893 [Fulvia fulva]UJO21392.1 hypothetical protein CLAFUR5_10893 [Fulvia fulva]